MAVDTSSAAPARESGKRLDDAARAGWLYYVAGKRQDDARRFTPGSRHLSRHRVQ